MDANPAPMVRSSWFWTPERDAAIESGFEAGLTARSIGERLGVSRNAVLGRHFRLGHSQPMGKRKAAPPKLKRRDGLIPLGQAARACGFTVAMLEEILKDIEEAKL